MKLFTFLNKKFLFSKKAFGDIGEDIAESFLISNGYKILEKNYRIKKGEIDIIAMNNDDLIAFIEVKTRSSAKFGLPEEAVNLRKQRNISNVAKYYINSRKLKNISYRADIISIMFENNNTPKISHLTNAFQIL